MKKIVLSVGLIVITVIAISTYLFITNHLKINPDNPETYKNCVFNNDCKLVESSRACMEVESINKKISDEVWQDFMENKVPKTYDKCPLSELNIKNTKPICRLGDCLAVEK